MKSYNRPKGFDAHWGDPKGKGKGKEKGPKGKGKGMKGKSDPGGKGPYADTAGGGSANTQEYGQPQQEGYENETYAQTPQDNSWGGYQTDWYDEWSGLSWYESGFAAHQQQLLAADSSNVSWRHERSFS